MERPPSAFAKKFPAITHGHYLFNLPGVSAIVTLLRQAAGKHVSNGWMGFFPITGLSEVSASNHTVERKGVEGIAVVSGGSKAALTADQNALLPIYLTSIRERFKNEINRLTSGGVMQAMLRDQPDASALSFPMSYLYAWHW